MNRSSAESIRWLAGLPVPQWRFWVAEVHHPGNPDGIDSFVFRIEGSLDVDALGKAFQTVVGWHEALRTHISRVGARGTHTEVVDPADISTVLRVRTSSQSEIANAPDEPAVSAFIARAFRLDSDLPVRALLLTGSDSRGADHSLVVCTHHTAVDGWSAGVLFADLALAYDARIGGQPIPEREASSYRRIWREQEPSDTDGERTQLLRWARHILGVPDLRLSTRPRDATPTAPTPISQQWPEVTEELTVRIRAAASVCGVTVIALLLTGWVRALRAITGATDFAVGVPVTGRSSLTSTTAIGCFTSAVALRFRGNAGTTVATDVEAIVSNLRYALRFQFMPLEHLRREDSPRDPHRTPFCQAGFVSQSEDTTSLRLTGARCEHIPRPKVGSAHELTLEVSMGTQISARIWRRVDVLDDQRAAELGQRWLDELDAVCHDLLAEPTAHV